MKNTGIVIASLVGGMILGSALTMLLTPQSGPELRRQIKDYLEDAASAKMAAEEARRENASLKRRVDELERRLRRNQFPAEDE